jgi:hypothetical protein
MSITFGYHSAFAIWTGLAPPDGPERLSIVGTVFTLFVIPSIYMPIARDHGKDREKAAVDLPDAA